ncbi:MAG: hypothetical protein LBN20_04970 [Endomicrobium sp.]|jgi:hypothetical protein|nr:hypothetical protein [Endomicrobium sp.]
MNLIIDEINRAHIKEAVDMVIKIIKGPRKCPFTKLTRTRYVSAKTYRA